MIIFFIFGAFFLAFLAWMLLETLDFTYSERAARITSIFVIILPIPSVVLWMWLTAGHGADSEAFAGFMGAFVGLPTAVLMDIVVIIWLLRSLSRDVK